MKKVYSWILLLLAVTCAGTAARAASISLTQPEGNWIYVTLNQPGACEFADNIQFDNALQVADDVTAFYYSYTSGSSIYVRPKSGHVFAEIVQPSGVVKTSFSASANYGGQFYSLFLGDSASGKDMVITTKSLNYTAEVTINVSNNEGNQLTGYFTGIQTPIDFSLPTQTIKFDPEYQKAIYFVCNNTDKKCFSATINGQDVPLINAYWGNYTTPELSGTDNVLDIVVNESAISNVTVSYQLPEGFEDCIASIRDVTGGTFLTAVDNTVTVVKGSTLRFNLALEGYTFSAFYLNNVDITNNWVHNNDMGTNYLEFVASEDAILKIEVATAVYENIPMTAYVMNPQGVVIRTGTYADGTAISMDGTPITANISLPSQSHSDSDGNITYVTPSFTLTPENASEIHFTVEDRRSYDAYISPAQGWYIATVQNAEKAEISTSYIGKNENNVFYVVAQPLTNDTKATINVDLSAELLNSLSFRANSGLAGNWGNPDFAYHLTNGVNTINYTKGYQSPFSLSTNAVSAGINCMIDQRVLTVTVDDEATSVNFPLDLVDGSVVDISTTDYDAEAYTVTVNASKGKSATYTYGALKRNGASGYKLQAGTEVNVKPGSTDCMLKINGTVVYSPSNNINDLTDGVYTFHIDAPVTIEVGNDANIVEITRFKPLNGQSLIEFESFTVTLPILGDDHMFYFDSSKLNTVTVTPEGGRAITASAIEPSMSVNGETEFIIMFEVIDQPGNYTVNIPEGFFFEAEYNEAAGDYVAVNGGAATAALVSHFVIDPNAPAYHLIPTAGTEVDNLSSIEIVFVDATFVDEAEEGAQITLTGTNYQQTAAQIVPVTGADYVTYRAMFATPPSEAGEYTLNIAAGSFTIDGWKESEAVTARYTYSPMWVLTPANGATINETNFTLTFPKAASVEFVGSRFDLMLSQGSNYSAPGLDIEEDTLADVPTYYISVNAEAQQPPYGTLTLTITEGAFVVDGADSPMIVATYNYEGTISLDYTCEPAGQSILIPTEDWGMVMWTFVFDELVTVRPSANTSDIKVTVNGAEVAFIAQTESNMLIMGLESKEGLKDGDVLNVVIPAGTYSLSGTDSPAIDRSWTLVAAKTYTWSATPDNGTKVNKIDTVVVSFEGATSVEVNESSPYIDVKSGYTLAGKMIATGDGGSLVLTAETPITVAGTYTMQVSPYQLTIDEVQTLSNWLELTYTVDPSLGVSNISIEEVKTVTVVTLDGRVVLENAEPVQLKTLAPGIYIVNGQKILVK